jgi:hypothetical protein
MNDKHYNGSGILSLCVRGFEYYMLCVRGYEYYMLWGLVIRSYSGKYLYELYD